MRYLHIFLLYPKFDQITAGFKVAFYPKDLYKNVRIINWENIFRKVKCVGNKYLFE